MRAHFVVVLLIVVAMGISNFVYVLHQTTKHHVNVEHHPTFRPLFVRSTRMLPSEEKTCGVGWEYRADEDRCVRALSRGVDARFVRDTTAACDDFYDNSCGAFNADPVNGHDVSLFSYVQRLNAEKVDELIENAAADTRVDRFYKSCQNRAATRALEFDSSRTIKALLTVAGPNKITTYAELATFWGYLQRYDTILPLELTLELDPWQTTRLLPSLHWSGVATAESVSAVTARLSLIYSPSVARTWAEYIVRMERDLLDIVDPVPSLSFFAYLRQGRGADFIDDWLPQLSNARFNVSRFIAACAPDDVSGDDWLATLAQRPMWTSSRGYLSRLPDVIERYTPETWLVYTKHAVLYHLDNDGAPKLAYHRLYDAQHALPWTRTRFAAAPVNATCVQLVQAFMPHTIDRMYAARYFSNESIAIAAAVATAVHRQFVETLAGTEFEEKMAALRLDVGVLPNSSSSTLTLRDGASYVDNVLQARRYHIDHNFKQVFREPLPLYVFSDGLGTSTAAYYQHQLNGLSVNVGMLQPPLFSPDFDDALLYSRLGVFVAHEMAHSIDRSGRLFGTDGSYVGGDVTGYSAYEQCLIDRYSERTPLGNTHNGVQTLNENFADIMGMRVAFAAYTAAAPRTDVDVQTFFRSYAQLFCHAPLSMAQEQSAITTSRHSLAVFRVNNVVAGVQEFQDAWHCKNRQDDFCAEQTT